MVQDIQIIIESITKRIWGVSARNRRCFETKTRNEVTKI